MNGPYPANEVLANKLNLTASVGEFDPVIKRLFALANRLETISHKLDMPDAPGLARPEGRIISTDSPPISVLNAISSKRSTLVDVANQFEYLIQNLEAII